MQERRNNNNKKHFNLLIRVLLESNYSTIYLGNTKDQNAWVKTAKIKKGAMNVERPS